MIQVSVRPMPRKGKGGATRGGGEGGQLTYTTGARMDEHTLPLRQAPKHDQLQVGRQENL